MSAEGVIYEGDPPKHRHDLPRVPEDDYGHPRKNAVAECSACGRLMVSKWDGDPWTSGWWTELRWYHLRARRAVDLR